MVNKQGKNVYENFLAIWFDLVSKVIIGAHFYKINYIKIQNDQTMSIVKVDLPFLYSSMKKKIKIRLIFDFINQNCAIFDLQYQIKPNT